MSPEAMTIPGRLDRLSIPPTAPLKPVVSTGGVRESGIGVVVLVSTGELAVSTGAGVLVDGASSDGLRPSLPPQAAAKTRNAPDITVRSREHLPECT
jgi:hypothetical protein